MIKLELFAEDRGLWRSRVVVSVMTMWHYYCRNARQSGMPFNEQGCRPVAKRNQEVDLGNKEPVVGSPKSRTIKLVRLQVVPSPYESCTATARKPKETQNGCNIERCNPGLFPADKPFGKMNMNHIRRLRRFFFL